MEKLTAEGLEVVNDLAQRARGLSPAQQRYVQFWTVFCEEANKRGQPVISASCPMSTRRASSLASPLAVSRRLAVRVARV